MLHTLVTHPSASILKRLIRLSLSRLFVSFVFDGPEFVVQSLSNEKSRQASQWHYVFGKCIREHRKLNFLVHRSSAPYHQAHRFQMPHHGRQ